MRPFLAIPFDVHCVGGSPTRTRMGCIPIQRRLIAMGPLISTAGSYFTPDDGFRHAIVSTSDGELHEAFYSSAAGSGVDTLAFFCGAKLVTAFFTPDDGYQHAIVATETGDIFDVFFKPGDFNVTGSLANFANMVALSGFYAANDQMRILIVGLADGSIHEVFYNSTIGVHVTQPALATIPGLIHLAAFYSDDDNYRHIIVATADGNITEVFYHPTIGVHVSQPPLANFKNILSLGAFYAENDQMRIVIVATTDGDVHEIFYRSDIGVHKTQPALANIPSLQGVSAFYTSDDGYRHVIAVGEDGNVTEILYSSAIGTHVSHPPIASFLAPVPALEMVGPDLSNLSPMSLLDVDNSSPAGRCVAIGGAPSRLYTLSHTGSVWSSANGDAWSLQAGSPAPANLSSSFTLAISPNSTARAAAGTDSGLWETTNAGASWSMILDPMTLGIGSSRITSVVFDDGDRLFVGLYDGLAVRVTAGAPFQLTKLGTAVTAIAVSESKVWARTASELVISTDHGVTWSSPFALPATIKIRPKELGALAVTDAFAYMVATLPGETGCAGDNILVIFNAHTNGWSTQRVLSADLSAWHVARGEPADSHTCDGTGSDISSDGRRFIKSFRLSNKLLSEVVGEGIQIFFGSGQEIWRARGQIADGTITDWNWVVGTHGYSDRDPVHADIWDFHIDTNFGGRTAWIAGDGGIYSAKVANAEYEFTSAVAWQPDMLGLHTHQIQMLTLLRSDHVSRPRLAYAIGDSGAFYRDTSAVVLPELSWNSYGGLGDGNWTAGDSSAPLYAQLVRNLEAEAFLRFGAPPVSAWLINPKSTTFVDPSLPTRFRFVPARWQEGQFKTADVVMMVDLPLTFTQNGNDVPFAVQPGPSSNGLPVLIRNRNFNTNPDINAANAKGVNWELERSVLPPSAQGFAVSGDRNQPSYYAFTANVLFAERNGSWTPILSDLMSSQVLGPVFPNPYDSGVIYALTSNKGVQVSVDAGSTFDADTQLNTLIGGDAGTVNQISFNYDRPSSVVVCTENGNVFQSSYLGQWNDLTPILPYPLIPIRSVAIDCEAVYVATLGRGLMRIVHYGSVWFCQRSCQQV
jgi:hypothetical protein